MKSETMGVGEGVSSILGAEIEPIGLKTTCIIARHFKLSVQLFHFKTSIKHLEVVPWMER